MRFSISRLINEPIPLIKLNAKRAAPILKGIYPISRHKNGKRMDVDVVMSDFNIEIIINNFNL